MGPAHPAAVDVYDALMSVSAVWSFPTAIRLAPGCIAELADTCERHGIRRPLIVTDPGFAELPVFEAVHAPFDRPVPVFSSIRPNPVGANISDGVEVFRAGGHDGVIAVGGGSALDSGKLIAFHAGQNRPLWDFEDIADHWTRADADSIAPVIAVPTTAGTGSEVGRAGVVIDEATHRKVIVFHPQMMPVAVLCDPELTIGLPTVLTVGTGMDALSHSLEAICAPSYHPMAHGIGLEGCRLVLEHLPRVVRDPARPRESNPDDGRRGDGGGRVPEGSGRDARTRPPDRRRLRHPPRHDQRGADALRPHRQP